jgi:GT2 family glycosyltransferase
LSDGVGQPTVSVIVLNYNGRVFLDGCLTALASQQVEGGFEVLVADNGSWDGSPAHVRERYPWVRVLEMERNLGFSAANNRAFGQAAGRHVVVLNNDANVRPGWLRGLVEAAEADPRVGAVTSKLVFAHSPGVIQNVGLLLFSDGGGGDRGVGEPDRGQYERREEVFGFCGAAALLRRQALQDVGGFDETFFAYYEDTDLSWRMRLRGWKVVYEPSAVVEHAHSATNREGSPFFRFHADRNRLFTLVKNGSPHLVASSFRAVCKQAFAARAKARAEARAQTAGSLRRVVLSFSLHLPEMLVKRFLIRLRSSIPDREIERWLYPRERWDESSG